VTALVGDLLAAADPVALARRVGVEPDEWQAQVLRSQSKRLLLLCSRQSGKSTVSAVAALHAAVYQPGSLVLIFAPSQRQAVELFRTVTRMYRALGRPVAPEQENTLSLSLENGSRLVALPGDERTVRGYSNAKLMIIDEAARVPDELYRSVRPMLAVSGGRLMALSTPFGRRGWFYEAATDERSGFEVTRVTAEQCPRITPGFLAEERTTQGDWLWRQEYGCEFVAANSSYFDAGDLAALLNPDIPPLFPGGRSEVVR
jgi:hypothetical protein